MKKEEKYFKEEFLKCEEFKNNKDLLNYILEDNKEYTKEEIKKIIKTYLEEII